MTVHYILAMHSRQICSYSDWPPTAAPVINSSAPAAVRRVGHCYQPWTSEVAAEAGLTGTTADRPETAGPPPRCSTVSVCCQITLVVSAPHCPPLQLPCLHGE